MVIIFLLGIILNSAAVMMKSTLDQFLGAGKKTVVGASNLDGLYFTSRSIQMGKQPKLQVMRLLSRSMPKAVSC